jgi:hypothetical protein
MGYYTTFSGKFKLSRNLTDDEDRQFNVFVNTRRCRPDDTNEPPEGQPSLWCDWRVEHDEGDPPYLMALDGKHYEHGEWLHYLCVTFFKPWGVTLHGRVDWQGDEEYDFGYYEIKEGDPTRINVYKGIPPQEVSYVHDDIFII